MNATLAKSNVAGILTGWREILDFRLPGTSVTLSRSTVCRLIKLGFLEPLGRGVSGTLRVRAADLDRARRELESARAAARERFGRRRRGAISDRLAVAAHLATRPNSRVRRARDAAAQAAQLGLFVQEGGAK